MKKSEINCEADEERRCVMLRRARSSFRDLERYLNVQDGFGVRDFLVYATAGYGELDSTGKSSNQALESKFGKLMKKAHLKAARQALDDVLTLHDPRQIETLFHHLKEANSTLDTLARERGKCQEKLIEEMVWILGGAKTRPDVKSIRKLKIGTLEN